MVLQPLLDGLDGYAVPAGGGGFAAGATLPAGLSPHNLENRHNVYVAIYHFTFGGHKMIWK